LQILAGQDLLAVYAAPGDAKSAVFCRVCGSSLFRAEWPDGPWVGVRLGTLDDDPGVVAEYHIFVDDDAAWDLLPDDRLPRYSGRPGAA
jgi:ADP-ribosyl-[dinitrogen reductase] hydrolase